MSIQIRVLIVEDSEDDIILIVRELKRNGYDVIFEQVDNCNKTLDDIRSTSSSTSEACSILLKYLG